VSERASNEPRSPYKEKKERTIESKTKEEEKERRTEPRLTHRPARERNKHNHTVPEMKQTLAMGGGNYTSEENAVLTKDCPSFWLPLGCVGVVGCLVVPLVKKDVRVQCFGSVLFDTQLSII
jgi:hypothetical protein